MSAHHTLNNSSPNATHIHNHGASNGPNATGGSSSTAFSRLNRPGSGRLLTAPGSNGNASGAEAHHAHSGSGGSSSWDRHARPGSGRSSGASSSSTPSSISPTSPSGPTLSGSGHHRPGTLTLPAPGGGIIPSGNVTSPEQAEKRQGLKISFSQPNMRRAGSASSNSSGGGGAPSCPPKVPSLQLPGVSALMTSQSVCEEKGRLLFYNTTHSTGKLKLGEGCEFDFKAEDLTDLGEIGRGAFGTVNKMRFQRDNVSKVMAVKRIRSTVDEREQKELLMDLGVVMQSNDCQFIVLFFGALFKEGDCWICMEVMDTSTDKFYKYIYEQLHESMPENVIGKITVATVSALNYLKEKLKIIHRDVKPSNILLDRSGNIKLCDFGISGQLVDSIAKTRDAGCRPYMAPERIDPQRAKGYDVRSDVWSLGITLIELSTGRFPYPKWNSVFEQLQQVVHGDPPRLDPRQSNVNFTIEFVNFVNTCLIKDELQRPKYTKLLDHPFIRRSESETVDVSAYVSNIMDRFVEQNGPSAVFGMTNTDSDVTPMDCDTK